MSHFTTIRTQIKNLEIIKKVLDNLGHNWEENSKIEGWKGRTRKVDLSINLQEHYLVGLKKNQDGIYDAIADWSMMRSATYKWQKVVQAYSVETVKHQASLMGYEVENEEINQGEIKIVIAGWS